MQVSPLLIAVLVVFVSQALATDLDILQFALNLEYLEANFYSCAATGKPIAKSLWGSKGVAPTGCTGAASLSPAAQAFALDIASDELAHVVFLRKAITAAGGTPVDQPLLNIGTAFSAAANAAFKTTLAVPFNAYADDTLFYHAAYIFEDVGATAYHGALGAITTPAYLSAAAGIMATEAYHAGAVRMLLINIANEYVFPYGVPVSAITQAISNLRASADGTLATGSPDDTGPYNATSKTNNLVPTDSNAIVYSRTTTQVLAIVSLGAKDNKGGFFPNGLNGNIK